MSALTAALTEALKGTPGTAKLTAPSGDGEPSR